jgi:hypothetical protein
MKIAIQGHPTRGEEIIQILESLGGKKFLVLLASDECLVFFIDDKGYISCFHRRSSVVKECYKIYTLEEFEKEFPFKIGDKVITTTSKHPKIITGITNTQWGLRYIISQIKFPDCKEMPHISQISLYKEMKEERNITLTLDKAKEWYNKGGELREIALQAFTKEELNPLPKTWEEYCKMYPVIPEKHIFLSCCSQRYIALWKLEQLRDCYRQGWKPKSKECAFAIKYAERGLDIYLYSSQEFLSFQSREVAEEFLKNFEPLIKEAEDLI